MFSRAPWRKVLLISAVLALTGFAAIQAVPYGRDHSNPDVTMEPQWDSPRTRELAARACFDCHSNDVNWPWYSNVAPVSWWIQGHVDDGRKALNFSEWDRPQDDAHEAAETVFEGEMPPGYYKPWGGLSDAELDDLARGLLATLGGEGGGPDGDDD